MDSVPDEGEADQRERAMEEVDKLREISCRIAAIVAGSKNKDFQVKVLRLLGLTGLDKDNISGAIYQGLAQVFVKMLSKRKRKRVGEDWKEVFISELSRGTLRDETPVGIAQEYQGRTILRGFESRDMVVQQTFEELFNDFE